jgi:hypothetical protein
MHNRNRSDLPGSIFGAITKSDNGKISDSPLRVAIVGYGILGMVAADFLDDQRIEIHIFDLVQGQEGCGYFPEPAGPRSLHHPKSSPVGSPGNRDFWGRAVTNYIDSESLWPSEFISNLPRYNRVMSKYGFPKLILQKHENTKGYLKVSYADFQKFKKRIRSKKFSSRIVRHYALVHSLVHSDDSISVITQEEGKRAQGESFDYVLVCAGPLNSFNLINKSRLIPEVKSTEFRDHPNIVLGGIKTGKSVLIKRRFRNKAITYGPETLSTKFASKRLITEKSISFIRRVFSKFFGFFYCDTFTVTAAFDFTKPDIFGIVSNTGEISQFTYSAYGPKVDSLLIQKVDEAIKENFGDFERTWGINSSLFEEIAAAHCSGFLGLFRDSRGEGVLDGFRLRNFSRISIPGSVSFPSSVVGHPTYLALCTVLFEVEGIKSRL